MMRICLVNMPLAPLSLPSLALTQLKSKVDSEFAGKDVHTEIHYFNLDFCQFFGIKNYQFLTANDYSAGKNFGEWYFRQEAFPELPDNKAAYFERYELDMENWFKVSEAKNGFKRNQFIHRKMLQVVDALSTKRHELGAFLDKLILDNGLHKADIIGLTSMFQQNLPCFALARRIKLFNPAAKIIMGGANCESPMGEKIVQYVSAVDYVFSGSALSSFPTFVDHCLQGQNGACDQIDGVFSIRNQGIVKSLGKEMSINEVVELDYNSYLEKATPILRCVSQKPALLFETARGCWWGAKAHCTFCGLNGGTMAYRAMKPEVAIPFLSQLFNRYAAQVDRFNCVDNIMPKEYPAEVFNELDVPEGMTIFYEVKSDLSFEDMEILKSKGITVIQPGIEAMDSSILKLMRKGVTSVKNIKTLRNGAIAGIYTHWNLLFGFPGEQEDPYLHYEKMLPALFHLIPPDVMATVRFDRYSPYHMQAKEYGLDLKPMEIYYYLYPDISEEDMMNLVYYFEDQKEGQGYRKLSFKFYQRLQEIHKQWINRWNAYDHKEIPEVYFTKEVNQVYDSRTGTVVLHQVSYSQAEILHVLEEPSNAGKLRAVIGEEFRSTLEQDLQDLIDKRLVFHDHMKSFISLVFAAPIRKLHANKELLQHEVQD